MSARPNGTARPRCTLAILARDGTRGLQETLQSGAGWADETVVVDLCSRDDVPDNCRRHGARLVEHKWENDFSAARNAAYDAITGDWVLWLDAGEIIGRNEASLLREFVDREAGSDTLYLLYVSVPPVVGHASSERVLQPRLLPNHPQLRFRGRVCESVLAAAETAGIGIAHLECELRRGAQEHDPQVKARRATTDLQLLELEIKEQGEQPQLVLAVGEALAALGQHRAAIGQFQRAAGLAARGSTTMLAAYYGLLASCDHDPGQRQAQINACMEAMDIYPLDAQLLCGLGSYMLQQNRLDLAARSYHVAFTHGQIDPQTWHLTNIGEVAAACLSLTQQLQGEDDAARATLEAALQRWSDSLRLRRHLINLHIKHQRSEAALAETDALPSDLAGREALRCAVRGGLLAARENWLAALPYLKTAYAASCRDPLCLRWLSIVYLSTGNAQQAEPILQEWAKQEPDSQEVKAYLAAVAEALGGPDARSNQAAEIALQRAEQESHRPHDQQDKRRLRWDAVPEDKPPAAHPAGKPQQAPSASPIPPINSPGVVDPTSNV